MMTITGIITGIITSRAGERFFWANPGSANVPRHSAMSQPPLGVSVCFSDAPFVYNLIESITKVS